MVNWDPEKIGIVAGVVLILILGSKGVWVWGYQHKQALARNDKLEDIIYRLLGVTAKMVDREKKETQEIS